MRLLRPTIKTAVRERNWWRVSKIAKEHPPMIKPALLRAKSVTGSVPDLQTSDCNVSLSPRDGSLDVRYFHFIPSNLQGKRRDASGTQIYEKCTKFMENIFYGKLVTECWFSVGNLFLIPSRRILYHIFHIYVYITYITFLSKVCKNILCTFMQIFIKRSNIIAETTY